MTREQVIKFLIKTDLEMQNINDDLTNEGRKALMQLSFDDDISGIEMADIIRWINENLDVC